MLDNNELLLPVVVVILTILVLIVFFLLLLVTNNNRKNRHKLEVSELKYKFDREVVQAEREAIQTTMSKIGSELHDNIGQLLTAAQIGIMNKYDEKIETDSELSLILDTLEEGIEEVSRLGRTLNVDLWKDKTLFKAIEEEAIRLEKMGICVVHFEQKEDDMNISSEDSIILFRMFQEIINNSIKHGKAQLISIRLCSNPLSMEIKDNGVGCDVLSIKRGAGLNNIQRRAELIGCKASMKSSIGNGCTWSINKKTNK